MSGEFNGFGCFRTIREVFSWPAGVSNCRSWSPLERSIAVALLIFLCGGSASAQSPDEAINEQLKAFPKPCAILLDGDTTDVLEGPLKTEICERLESFPGAGPTVASGFGGVTSTSLPTIVQQQLREQRQDEESPEDDNTSGGGASADAQTALGDGVNLFVSGQAESLDKNGTHFEGGYDSGIWRVTGGAGYEFTDRLLAGLAFDFLHQDGEFDSEGDFDSESYGLLAFAGVLPAENIYIEASGGWSRINYEIRPEIFFSVPRGSGQDPKVFGGAVNGEYSGDKYQAGITAGYDYAVGGIALSPYAGMDWQRINFEDYCQTGDTGLELCFEEDGITSLQTRLGVQASTGFVAGSILIIPHAAFDWRHEFDDDQRDIFVSFAGDTRGKLFSFQSEMPDRDWYEIDAGVDLVLLNGLELYGTYHTLIGNRIFESHKGIIGVRIRY